jgi:hypothetical protein
MTWIGVTFHGQPLVICGVSMFSGGLIGGMAILVAP